MEEEIFQIVFPGQIWRKQQERGAGYQYDDKKGDDDTSWGHSGTPLQNEMATGYYPGAKSQRTTLTERHIPAPGPSEEEEFFQRLIVILPNHSRES